MRLKTKLVLAISIMVCALVAVLSYVYVSQLIRQHITDTYGDAEFVAKEMLTTARDALQTDLSSTRIDVNNPAAMRVFIEQSLQDDPGMTTLLQAIVGYSPTIYDAAIADTNGRAFVHTDAEFQDKALPNRPLLQTIRNGGFWHQVKIVYGKPDVYEIRLPVERDGAPFGDIRIGVSTVFLKNHLKPQLDKAIVFAGIAMLVSVLLAAVLSSFALRPLEAIGRRLDRMTAGMIETAPEDRGRKDEYGVVSTKIDRLGRQMRDVKEVFSALKGNLDQIMANLQDGLMLFTRDSRVVLVSASAERFAGLSRADMLGRKVDEIFSRSSPLGELILNGFRERQSVPPRDVQADNGRRAQVSLDFIEEHGERIGALLTIRDAESVRRIEDEIELSRRLAAIGRLTSGVAHEVKNPINAIVLHLEVLREKTLHLDPDSRRHMDVIGKEIQRLDRVVQTLVDFTRPVELRLAETDLRRLVEDTLLLAGPDVAAHGIRLAVQLPSEPLPTKVDADLVKQALLNVVINGVQAMPEGGVLTITGMQRDGSALIEVSDQGTGIAPEIRDKIFNLYFTTKKQGSGIGLAMAYRVMQLHNGSLEFESTPGFGTTFRLRVPLHQARGDQAQQAAAESVLPFPSPRFKT
jgi:PAS domain S-box-containing protein